MFIIQYDKITGRITGDGQCAPDQIPVVTEDMPIGQLVFQDPFDRSLKKINPETKAIEDCPRLLKNNHNGPIYDQLREIDMATFRAMREWLIAQGSAPAAALEEKANTLRAQLIKD